MIPEGFKIKMKKILGGEYEEFIDALENRPAVRGLRVNLNKLSAEDFLGHTELKLSQVPYCSNGFILEDDTQIGAHPAHHAGMIYMQDPGAMATVSAVDIPEDAWVLDLCAAPGGKSSQIAERLSENGFLLSNEYVPKRAKIIVGNFERLGVKNAMVTSLDTRELGKMFSAVFDLVIADAPCSGEGMFRKSDEALAEWSEENVELCARRQLEILDNAADTVKSGGYLLYSTCTYSPEENEDVVSIFLEKHPDYRLVSTLPVLDGYTAKGIKKEGFNKDIELSRRFYPHLCDGEGQYIALMQREPELALKPTILYKSDVKQPSKDELTIINAFINDNLIKAPEGRIAKVGENIVLLTHNCPIPKHSVFMAGVLLGEIKGKTFAPSHQFFSACGRLFKACVNLTDEDERLERYLFGEEIEDTDNLKGWCCVMYCGVPLGGGKASGGRIKNHYPKGLRKQ